MHKIIAEDSIENLQHNLAILENSNFKLTNEEFTVVDISKKRKFEKQPDFKPAKKAKKNSFL